MMGYYDLKYLGGGLWASYDVYNPQQEYICEASRKHCIQVAESLGYIWSGA